MSVSVAYRGPLLLSLSHCSSCSFDISSRRPFLPSPGFSQRKRRRLQTQFKILRLCERRRIASRVTETQSEPDSNSDKEKEAHGGEEIPSTTESVVQVESEPESQPNFVNQINNSDGETNTESGTTQDVDDIEVASGSPLPGVKPQQLDESIRIPKETIDILKDQVFGFDTFFVTSQEPYEVSYRFQKLSTLQFYDSFLCI
uniref:Uncharacterized protein n=1 Tax=Rhizophora mucronata TaxID=61149 RepID=A0A2P2LQ55_RHIMU